MSGLITAALGGTILLAAVGGVALSVLVARYGICACGEAVDWTPRRCFFARCTYFAVGASLALCGLMAAVALAVALGTGAHAARERSSEEVHALEARIHALEATLGRPELRTGRSPRSSALVE